MAYTRGFGWPTRGFDWSTRGVRMAYEQDTIMCLEMFENWARWSPKLEFPPGYFWNLGGGLLYNGGMVGGMTEGSYWFRFYFNIFTDVDEPIPTIECVHCMH